MPRVPDWQAPRTSTPTLPAGGLRAVPVTYQEDNLGQGLMALGRVAPRFIKALQDEADAPQILQAQDAYLAAEQRQTYDPEQGYLAQKGGHALRREDGKSLEQDYQERLGKDAQSIRQSLPLERQREQFDLYVQKRQPLFRQGLIEHTFKQALAYQKDVLQSHIAGAQSAMLLDADNPTALAEHRQAIRAGVWALGQQQGLSAEHIEQAQLEQLSIGHEGALSSLLQGTQTDKAAAYLQQNGAEMLPAARAKFQDALANMQRGQAAEAIAQQLYRQAGAPAPLSASEQQKRLQASQIQIESRGRVDAKSDKGALGLMQLLPQTAREMAAELGMPYDEARLATDGAYNTQLGNAYRDKLLSRYGGNLTLALAAYNGGMKHVDAWIKRFGDPRTGAISADAWLSKVPFSETRAYVHNVLDAAGMDANGNDLLLPSAATRAAQQAKAQIALSRLADPKLRTQAAARLKSLQQADQAAQDALFEQAADLVQQQGYEQIPQATLLQLPSEAKEKLFRLDDLYHRSKDIETDYNAMQRYLSLPADELAQQSLHALRLIASKADFAVLRKAWQDARNGDSSTLLYRKGEMQAVFEAMHTVGIVTGDSQKAQEKANAKRQQQFMAAYQSERERFVQDNQREPNRNEVEALTDRLLLQVKRPREYWFDERLRYYEVNPEDRPRVYIDDPNLALDDIPPSVRAAIVANLQAGGLEATPRLILEQYQQHLHAQGFRLESDGQVSHAP